MLGGVLARRTSPLLHIACGAHYCLVAGAQADDVVGWGDGSKLQLGPTPRGGDGVLWEPIALPALGAAELSVVCLSAGAHHAAAVLSGGECVLWGGGEHGELGRGDRASDGRAAPCSVAPSSASHCDRLVRAQHHRRGRQRRAAARVGRLWAAEEEEAEEEEEAWTRLARWQFRWSRWGGRRAAPS